MYSVISEILFIGFALALPLTAFANGNQVSVTSHGFSPKELTVSQGETVRFTNADLVSHWPASNPHPIHDDYTEFDPKFELKPGTSWSIEFTKPGVFRYHDHLYPQMRGTVRVQKKWRFPDVRKIPARLHNFFTSLRMNFSGYTDSYGLSFKKPTQQIDAYMLSQMRLCYPHGNRNACYKNLAGILLKQFTVFEILSSMKRIEPEKEVFGRCHEVGHYIGRTLYRKTNSIPESYAACDVMVCGVGCQHGAGEEFFRAKKLSVDSNDKELSKEVQRACGLEKSYARPILYHECLHGLGHGIMAFTLMDLPRSLALCDSFPSDWDKEGCYAGVFMENATSFTIPEHTTSYLKKDDPLYPCYTLATRYQKLCYEYQTTYFGGLTKWDPQKTIAICKTIPAPYQNVCFGQIAAHEAMSTRDFSRMKASCDLIKELTSRVQCVNDVVSTLGGRYIDAPEMMLQFCAIVSPDSKQICYELLGNQILYWGKTPRQRDTVCDTIGNKKYVDWCKNPVLLTPR